MTFCKTKWHIFLMYVVYVKSQTKVGDSCVDSFTNTIGRCTAAESCDSARRDFQQNGIRPTFCTYSAFGTTLVCCRDGTNILQTADPKPMRPVWGNTSNKQTDQRRVSERNDKVPITTYKPPVEPYIHEYDKGDGSSQNSDSSQETQIEDREFYIKDSDKLLPDYYQTEEDLITKLWTLKLKKLLSEQRRYAEKIINDILFQAEMGTLTKQHIDLTTKNDCECTLTPTPKSVFRTTIESTETNDDKKSDSNSTPILQLKLTMNGAALVDRSLKHYIECEEYSRGVVEKVDFIPLLPDPETMSISAAKCDYTGVELIVGGENANQGEFPHMAALGWANFEGGYDFNCGGSLISARYVLSAGHCTRNPRASRDPAPAIVRLGDQNIDPNVVDGANPIEVPIKNILSHPNYKPPRKYNDIALFELASDVTFSATIRPACLWRRSDLGGHKKALATGWGVTDAATKQTSKELQKVSLSLLDNNQCDQLLQSNRNRHWSGFQQSQMCAGELRGGKDTCQGDSGSPLQVTSKDNQCIFHIIGITSFGRKCAESGMPAVYTRVSSYLDWIESVVWPGE